MATTKDRIGSELRHFELSETGTEILAEITTSNALDLLPLRSDGLSWKAARHGDAADCCLVLGPRSFQAHVPKVTHPTNCDCDVQSYWKNADSKNSLVADMTVKVSSGHLSRSPWRRGNEDINGMWRGISCRSQSLLAIDGKEKKLLRKACVEHGGAVG